MSSTPTVYAVHGMTCAHCERAVTEEVAAVAGVTAVDADAAAGTVTVTAAGESTRPRSRAAVDEAGYLLAGRRLSHERQPPRASARIELAIGGMTCASCAARIEKKLNRMDGVTATVNYATEKARVAVGPGVGRGRPDRHGRAHRLHRAGAGAAAADGAAADGGAPDGLLRRLLVTAVAQRAGDHR